MTDVERIDRLEDRIVRCEEAAVKLADTVKLLEGHEGKLGVAQQVRLLWSFHYYVGYFFVFLLGLLIHKLLHW